MASRYIPEDAICETECSHPDCIEMQLIVKRRCTTCNESIGHRHYFGDLEDGMEHWACATDRQEKGGAA